MVIRSFSGDHSQEEIRNMEPIASYDAKGGDPKNAKPVKDKDGKHSAGLTTAGKGTVGSLRNPPATAGGSDPGLRVGDPRFGSG